MDERKSYPYRKKINNFFLKLEAGTSLFGMCIYLNYIQTALLVSTLHTRNLLKSVPNVVQDIRK